MPDEKDSVFPHGQKPGSLELAFVGDSVYDLFVRAHVTLRGGKVHALSDKAVSVVNAASQARALEKIEPLLTPEEKAIVKRARNCRQTPTKHADPMDYARATALEALMGYLYLTKQTERLNELLRNATEMEGSL